MSSRCIVTLLSLLASASAASAVVYNVPPNAEEWLPDQDAIVRLESQLQLPQTAGNLDTYARYYSGYRLQGDRIIFGVLLSPRLQRQLRPTLVDGKTTFQIMSGYDHMPQIIGRNCERIDLELNVETSELTVQCEN
jgi:hypothetical protein